ncbi:ATP synthase F1 subunit delta [Hymenobacter sp. ASUV-10]|uniref:ATP synthase subunit delta n=1 Tax=Hymenobacter aranciens TaxID=3063996 RepID=A0ABT9B519_9BACT|nr:ATP synthase F1 subunit delta [Hymenobacter sp. ASUV-10]MDO7873360.1 ATP synthase F1 subunit delta [Hymenobacter sp. ASUV-10]
MADQRVAARYAKSLLDLGREQGVLAEVKQDMDLLATTVAGSRDLRLLLRNPIVKHDKKQAILEAVFKGKVSDMTLRFFLIMTQKNRESVLEHVAPEFLIQYNLLQGIQKAEVTSAAPLTPELRARMEALVKERSGLEHVTLTEKVDPDLIGGFVLRVGDQQIDDSVRTGLRKLRTSLQDKTFQNQLG